MLKVEGERTPALAYTLPLPLPPIFSFSEPATVVLPPPIPSTPLEGPDMSDANTIHFSPGEPLPPLPSSAFVYLAGAEGCYRSQSRFPKLLLEFRSSLRNDQLLFTPLLSLPHRYPLYALLGVDLFDSAPIVEATRAGSFLTLEGWMKRNEVKEVVVDDLLAHNTKVALEELAGVRQALRSGTLRIMAEARAVYDPWAASVLRILDRDHYTFMEQNTPVLGPRLPTSHPHAMNWPEICRYGDRLVTRYERPEMADILLLLPCSAYKPYSLSRGHRAVHEVVWNSGLATRVHEVVVTSPMGIVPRELETFYPNMQYDTAVTGDWTEEERRNISSLLALFLSRPYKHVIIHLPDDYLSLVGVDGERTWQGRIDSSGSLAQLAEALRSIGGARGGKKDAKERLRQDMQGRLLFQFGPAGRALAEGVEIRGRYPDQRILANGEQRGMLTKERGLISLTMDGGKLLAQEPAYGVEIEDFKPKGDIFAVGVVDADPVIRRGDDVVVVHKGEVRAVGVANMTPKGMIEGRRGIAVRTRSHG